MIQEILMKIKKLREDRGLSLKDVAKGIGYKSGKGYYEVESGKISLKVEHVEKLANFYGISVTYFFR